MNQPTLFPRHKQQLASSQEKSHASKWRKYLVNFPLRLRSLLANLFTSHIKKLQNSEGAVVHKETGHYAILLVPFEILSNNRNDRIATLAPQNQVNRFAWLIEEQIVTLPLGIDFVSLRDLQPLPPFSPFIEMLKPLRPLGIEALKLQLEIEKLEIRARKLVNFSEELQSTSFEKQFISCQKAIQRIATQHQQATHLIAGIEQVVRDFRVILNFDSFAKQEQLLPSISWQQQIKMRQDETQKSTLWLQLVKKLCRRLE